MLLMFGTDTAIRGATPGYLGGELAGDSARFIVFQRVQIPGGIRGDKCFMPPVLRAIFSQKYGAATDDYLRVYETTALRAETARPLIK